jgi:hypothetical protein
MESKKDIINFITGLKFLFKPSYWLMNDPYSKEIDRVVSELLDKNELTDLDYMECIASLGKIQIWVGNRPYACGQLWNPIIFNCRPSRFTIERLLKRFYELRKETRKSK